MRRQVDGQLVSFEVMERFLRNQFGVPEPIVIDKAEGIEYIHGGFAGRECALFPLIRADWDTALVAPDGCTLMFPLRAGQFVLTSADAKGHSGLLMDARYDLDAFQVSGVVTEAIYQQLGFKDDVRTAKAA